MALPSTSDAIRWGVKISRALSYKERQEFYHFIMNATTDLCGELGDTILEELEEEGKTV